VVPEEEGWSYLKIIVAVLFLIAASLPSPAESSPRVVHVFVALADNVNQGIVPVPAKLGNGDDPERNLYWGSAYGVKTFFARSREWALVATRRNPTASILERCIFKHRTSDVYLVADAYQGIQIRQAIVDFLGAAAGSDAETIEVVAGGKTTALHGGGGADLVAYAGHDGLMDFQLSSFPRKKGEASRPAIILACILALKGGNVNLLDGSAR
jgi:hypothetical protein